MPPRQSREKNAGDKTPAPSRIMQSRFRNICSCGRSIARGELIYYDRAAKNKIRCMPCGGKLVQQGGAERREAHLEQPPQVEEAIQKVRILQADKSDLAASLEKRKEYVHQLWTLRENHSDQSTVRKLFLELSACRRNGVELFILRAKYPGKCTHCQEPQNQGSLILYDQGLRRIHCLGCEIEELQINRPKT